MRNEAIISAVVLGLVIGIGQFYYVTTKTIQPKPQQIRQIRDGELTCMAISPECGYCMGRTVGDLCYSNPYKQKFRGFPLSNGSYGFDSRTDVNRKLFINLAIFVIGLPVLVALFKPLSKLKHRNKH